MVAFRDCRGELVQWDADGEPYYPERDAGARLSRCVKPAVNQRRGLRPGAVANPRRLQR
jgi:hypothetical protein